MSTHRFETAAPMPRTITTVPVSRPDPELPGFEHCFGSVDGVRLHYVSGGKADGEVVLLLAGFTESWSLPETYESQHVAPRKAPLRIQVRHKPL